MASPEKGGDTVDHPYPPNQASFVAKSVASSSRDAFPVNEPYKYLKRFACPACANCFDEKPEDAQPYHCGECIKDLPLSFLEIRVKDYERKKMELKTVEASLNDIKRRLEWHVNYWSKRELLLPTNDDYFKKLVARLWARKFFSAEQDQLTITRYGIKEYLRGMKTFLISQGIAVTD